VPGDAAFSHDSWYFGCTACGKCCDSPPRLFLPELFHHQARFVGCLGLRRVGVGVEIFAHGFGFSSQKRCPALQVDGGCSLHGDRKPRICSVVPFDGARPDVEQPAVLAARGAEAQFWGAECIRAQPAPGFREVTRRLRVVDAEVQAALGAYRRESSDEQRFWIEGVRRLLGPELLDRPEQVRALPENGVLVLALVPALALMAEVSLRCHERVVSFVKAQDCLMSSLLEESVARRNAGDRDDTALLSRLLTSNRALLRLLLQKPPPPRARRAELAAAMESWLGV
jgi:hypothetical protein